MRLPSGEEVGAGAAWPAPAGAAPYGTIGFCAIARLTSSIRALMAAMSAFPFGVLADTQLTQSDNCFW